MVDVEEPSSLWEVPCLEFYLSLVSVALIKTMTKSNLGREGFIWFTLPQSVFGEVRQEPSLLGFLLWLDQLAFLYNLDPTTCSH